MAAEVTLLKQIILVFVELPPTNMNLLETKILIIFIFGVFSFLIGLATIPLK